MQHKTTSPKIYVPIGKANEWQKYNLKLLQFRDVQMKYAQFKKMKQMMDTANTTTVFKDESPSVSNLVTAR